MLYYRDCHKKTRKQLTPHFIFDPHLIVLRPNDSEEFYLIQIPVEEDNMGENFTPKLPKLMLHIAPEAKLNVVRQLTSVNEVRLDSFFGRMDSDWTCPLQRVKTSADVTGYGKVCPKYSTKTDGSILAKVRVLSVQLNAD